MKRYREKDIRWLKSGVKLSAAFKMCLFSQTQGAKKTPKIYIKDLKCRIERSNELKPYEALANAIIVQAAEDYRKVRTRKWEIDEIEKFFNSEMFAYMTNADPRFIIENLREENKYG